MYTDETWANAHDGRERTWVERDDATGGRKGGMRKPTGKGDRLIILHAGVRMDGLKEQIWCLQARKLLETIIMQ